MYQFPNVSSAGSTLTQQWVIMLCFLVFMEGGSAGDRLINTFKGVVNCQNSRDKGPPEGNSARG